MSILIKGMTRPKNCFECHLTKWIDDGCAGCVVDGKIHNASKPVDCPLIEIPEPQERRKAPKIVRCGECVNFAERDFCKVAGHNVHRKSNCMQVFGAERRIDA